MSSSLEVGIGLSARLIMGRSIIKYNLTYRTVRTIFLDLVNV